MRRIGPLYVAALLAFGLLVGALLWANPAWRELPVPAVILPLGLSLLIDLALLPLAQAGRVQPLTMNERAMGVIGAGLIITVLLALAPA